MAFPERIPGSGKCPRIAGQSPHPARAMGMSKLSWVFCIPDAKTGGRIVPLGPEARALLADLPRDEDNPWVIRGKVLGTHLTDLQRPWRRIRARAGLEDVRIHDLRHSYASRALALGESLTMIGKLLGHTQVQTTARYAYPTRSGPSWTSTGRAEYIPVGASPPCGSIIASRRLASACRSPPARCQPATHRVTRPKNHAQINSGSNRWHQWDEPVHGKTPGTLDNPCIVH